MSDRYFEPADVERLIPRLTRIMERVRSAHAAGAEARDALAVEQRRITLAGGVVLDQAAWKSRAELIERSMNEVRAGLEEIRQLGGTTKDLGMGLVDFPHLREGHEVNLCWRLGEQRITHWHGLDEGYAARKPL
ncbi:MAG TPA: DUF2203 domain-containing protein [Methylomirabilota bacterium]|nr:DUF2203 domain-containing protein [Methylomirabilota bacterium]